MNARSKFYELAKNVVKRKAVDLHVPKNKLYICKAKNYYIAYVKLSNAMVPLGILEKTTKEGKTHMRIEIRPFDGLEIENAANNICLCGSNSLKCALKTKKKL